MKKNFADSVLKTINLFPENLIFLITGTAILIIPMIATIGQFANTGFFQKLTPVLLFYWPGSDMEIKLNIYVWIFMFLVFLSFVAGLLYLLREKSLGKVILFTILIFICSGLIKTFLSRTFGWEENALPDLNGKANQTILALWHNPIWEEIIFRGIPLLMLLAIEKYITGKRTLTGVMIYCIVPSVLCGIYHIPNHGILRFFDTLIIGAGFSWMALKYSFFAPVVMHYIADAMMVLSLNKIPTIQSSEVGWIIKYGSSLNSFFFMGTIILLLLVPILMVYYFKRNQALAKKAE